MRVPQPSPGTPALGSAREPHCHCERREAISWRWGLLRRSAPRNDSVALMTDDLAYTSAAKLTALIARGAVSPVEVVDAVLDRIEQAQPALNAFITMCGE